MELLGTKKRHFPTSEFMGKFNCKADFVKYFKEHRKSSFILNFRFTVQLYLPEDTMFNKDFLK